MSVQSFLRFYGGAAADLLTSRRREKEWAAHDERGEAWQRKQDAAAPGRYYGGTGTIHGTTVLDVEVHKGQVVSVWFRCQMLPFRQRDVDSRRVDEMADPGPLPALTGIEVLDPDPGATA